MPRVFNHYALSEAERANKVYIGRGGNSPWGNPFPMGRHGSREEVVAKYSEWLKTRPDLIQKAKAELKGKDLVCFCAPKACHGDILLKIANE